MHQPKQNTPDCSVDTVRLQIQRFLPNRRELNVLGCPSTANHVKDVNKLTVKEFLQFESASGVMILLSALAALVFANSPLSYFYGKILETPVAIQVGALAINKPLLLWINDGLMAISFFSSAWK